MLIHRNPKLAGLLKSLLLQWKFERIEMEQVESVSEGMEGLMHQYWVCALLDTTSLGINPNLVTQIVLQASHVPLMVLVPRGLESIGQDAVLAGAQDWLVADGLSSDLLGKAISYAEERHRLVNTLRSMSLIDDITGLYNKTGLVAVATPQMAIAARQRRRALFLTIDLADAEAIEARLGAHERRNATYLTGQILWQCLRRSDLVGRIEPESFAAFAHEASGTHAPSIAKRLAEAANRRRQSEGWPFALRFVIGWIEIDESTTSFDMDELIGRARAKAANYG